MTENITEATAPQQRQIGRPFQPGQSGNPVGRPKGSRNKLGEAFLQALHEDFKANGIEAIQACRKDKPDAYLRVIAAILPEQIEITTREFVVVVPAEAQSVDEWLSQSGVQAAIQ
jgi:ribulose bisphosphate carboxylase small subunit